MPTCLCMGNGEKQPVSRHCQHWHSISMLAERIKLKWRGRGAAAGLWTWCPEDPEQKHVRTAQGYTDVPGRQDFTIFAVVDRVFHWRSQAFFDKCLSTFNCMAASSYVPPVGMKMTAFDFSKTVISERDKLCCTTAFFLLPSCGNHTRVFNTGSIYSMLTI